MAAQHQVDDSAKEHDQGNHHALIAAYQEVSKSYQVFADARTKLFIGFLPVTSAAGAFLINERISGQLSQSLLMSLSFFGFVVTLGALANELRWLSQLNTLIDLGEEIERELGVPGQFTRRPNLAPFVRSKNIDVVIYPTMLTIWPFIGLIWFSEVLAVVAALCFLLLSLVAVLWVRSTLPKL